MSFELKWSPDDETLLAALQQRRIDFFAAKRPAVYELVHEACVEANGAQSTITQGHVECLTTALLNRAGAMRDALAPFDSGVREAKPPRAADRPNYDLTGGSP